MAKANQFTSGTPCAWPHNGCFFLLQKILYFNFYNTILTQDLSGLEYQLTHANRIPPEANHQLLLFQALLLHLKEKFLKIFFNTCKRFQIIDQLRAFSCLNKSICSLEDSTLIKPTKGVLLRCTYCDTKQLLFSLLATQGPVGSLLVYITSIEFNTPF